MYYVPTETEGYTFKTTFHNDFDIADHYGLNAIKDTYNRAVEEWRSNIEYITELALVLNHRAWFWYNKNETFAKLYDFLYYTLVDYVDVNFSEKNLKYFYKVLD